MIIEFLNYLIFIYLSGCVVLNFFISLFFVSRNGICIKVK